MNKFQFIYGASITAVLNLLLYITALGGEIIKSGLVISLITIFIFSVGVKIALANTIKDGQSTDWKSVGSFALGSGIVTIVTLALSLLAIV